MHWLTIITVLDYGHVEQPAPLSIPYIVITVCNERYYWA